MVIVLNTTGLLKYEKSHDHFLLFHGYLSLNSSLERAWLWYLIRPSCWGVRKLTPCAYSCLQVEFMLVPWLYLNTRPLICIRSHLNDKHDCYSSLNFKAQLKWPTILKVVALPNFEYFWIHYKVGYFIRITLFFVVLSQLIIKLRNCPLGAINLKKCLLWKQSKGNFFCLESCKD